MKTWIEQHATAKRQMQTKNAPLIALVRKGAQTEVGDGSVTNAASTTVNMYCISDPTSGDTTTFEALSLINASAMRLFAINDVFGERAKQGDRLLWETVPYVVKAVQALDTLGPSIGAYLSVVGA